MKSFTKFALGAVMLAGATALTAAPVAAQVSFGFSVGTPNYYGGYYGRPSYYGYYGRPYYGPSYYSGYYPSYSYYNRSYYAPRSYYRGGPRRHR